MSEPEKSGEPVVASAETVSAPPAAVQSTAPQPAAPVVPSFGTSRGSGLARGKRGSVSASATAQAPAGDYKPTAIQVVNVEREYKNPFAPEVPPVAPTAPVEPVAAAMPAPAPAVAPVAAPAEAIPAPVAGPTATAPIRSEAVSASEEKAELKILPPEERPRPAQSWENNSFSKENQENRPAQGGPRRDERPTFRPERRDNRENRGGENRRDFRDNREQRDPRDSREPRENREPRDAREPREGGEFRRENREPRQQRSFEPRQAPAPAPQAEAPKKGFIAWLKGLFGGSSQPATPSAPVESTPPAQGDRRNDGGRRQHRGGRGGRGGFRGENRSGDFRSGENRGPRESNEGGEQGGSPSGDFQRDERGFEGGRRRRHRGGRGRGGFRGDNRGGEGRSEGSGGGES